MIQAYMNVDLNNPLAVKYHQLSLKSFECVKDIFNINVLQCITPDTLLDISFSDKKKRSPQEEATICSQYRLIERISQGEKLFVMEHDAYLIPERETIFRTIMSDYEKILTCNVGIAMECYTTHPSVAELFCELVRNDSTTRQKGPMGILHYATDVIARGNNSDRNWVYWPKEGKRNKTGLDVNVTKSHGRPKIVIDAPVTQLIDNLQGTTVTDRVHINNIYTPETHPNFHFVDIDNLEEK